VSAGRLVHKNMERDEIYKEAEIFCEELEKARENLYLCRAERGNEVAKKSGLAALEFYIRQAEGLIEEIETACYQYEEGELWGWINEIQSALDSFEFEVFNDDEDEE